MNQEPKWLNELRDGAGAAFFSLKLPQEREEAWRYTDLDALGMSDSSFSAAESEIAMEGGGDGIIFIDLLNAIKNHPDIIRNHMGKLVASEDKISSFHFSSIMNGVLVVVPDGKAAKLSSRITGGAHTIIVAGKNSRLEYIERHAGGGFATDAVEVFAGDGSVIDFMSLQNCGSGAKRFSFKAAKLGKGSELRWHFASNGAALHRTDANVMLDGEGSKAETLCAFKTDERQHVDFNVTCSHTVPHTSSNVLAKGTLSGKSSSVFRGTIRIDKEAQQTDSFLEDHALLLSDEAIANNIPRLEIDANDVKAKHGATVGQIDEEQLFYLMSRGLSREDAENLVVKGFLESLVSRVKNNEMKEELRRALE